MPVFLAPLLGFFRTGAGMVTLALLVALGVQTARIEAFLWIDGLKDNLEEARTERDKAIAGRKADRAAYEQAQRDAAAKNEAEVKRIETEQDRISSNVKSDLRARLERLRSELRKGTPASPSNPNGPKAGSDGGSPAEPDGQT